MTTNQPELRLFKALSFSRFGDIHQAYYTTAADRVDIVKRSFDRPAMEDALRVPDLQKSVADAIRRRLKKI